MLKEILAAYKVYQTYKAIKERASGLLEKPWVKSILGFLAGLFKTDPNAPKVHGAHDPSKPNTLDDILKSENQPPV